MNSDKKLHTCEICNKTFSIKGNLMTHLRTHTDKILHVCEISNKRFSLKQTLNIHLRMHAVHLHASGYMFVKFVTKNFQVKAF